MKTAEKCEAIIKEAFKQGYINKISQKTLREIIVQTLSCIDDRTLRNWEKGLIRLGYLKIYSAELYQWNLAKIPDLPQEVIFDPAQTRLFNG